MIIYYHCNSDNALLLSFTNLTSLHPLSFQEMIFIPVPPVFLHQKSCISSELSYVHAQLKMTTPSRRTRGRAMASHSDFREGKSRIVTILTM